MPTRTIKNRDADAADLVRKLMIEHGHSPRSLSAAILAKGVRAGYPPHRVKVSHDSLHLMFRTGHQPTPRIMFAIALYFDLKPGQIWGKYALDFDPRDVATAVAA
jgi:hypothetical protein